MIIWGSRTRFSKTDEGTFYCPQEQGDRPYEKKTAKQWFTLYFIPVFPMNEIGEVVECQTCKTQFDPRVLSLPTSHELAHNLTMAMRHAAVAIIQADGFVLDVEKQAAVTVMQRQDSGYAIDQLEQDLRTLPAADAQSYVAQCASSLDQFGKETLIGQLAYLAAIDGDVHASEVAVLEAIGVALMMTPAHVQGVITNIANPQPQTSQLHEG